MPPTIEDYAHLLAQAGSELEDQLVREMCEASLHDFVKEFWHVVEPGRPFVDNWHLQWMCQELEGITRGETTHLLMNVPPGAMKSLLMVFWTAWEWGPKKLPTLRYLCASYTQTLTIRDNRRRKAVLSDEKYKRLWPHVKIDPNRTSDENFGNTSTGWCIATSTGGVGTGERADRICVDDPHSVNTAESDAVRGQTLHWWREVIPTRVNDPQKSAFIVIMQRVHSDDVAGDILENRGEEWVHVMIPMRYEPDRHCVTDHGEDPRGLDEYGNLVPGMTEPGVIEPDSPLAQRSGKLYWPERFPEYTVVRDSIPLGRFGVASQFQQMPSPRGGGIILDIWWQIWPPADEFDKWVRPTLIEDGRMVNLMSFPPSEFTIAYLDTAFTEKDTNAYCAMLCLDVFADNDGHPKVMLRNAWQAHPTLRQLAEKVLEICRRHRVDCLVIENKAGANWVKQELMLLMRKGEFSIVLDEPRSDKTARLHSVSVLFEDSMVFAPNRDWADMVIKQTSEFPKGKYKDLVDCLSGGLGYLRRNDLIKLAVEHDEDEREKKIFRGNQGGIASLYGVG